MSLRDRAAWSLYMNNMAHYDIDFERAKFEWDFDPEVRKFWLAQVDIVLQVVECRCAA